MNQKYNLDLSQVPDTEWESISPIAKTRYCFIYCLQNKNNGKRYIGKSVCPRKRYLHHMSEIRRGTHPSIKDANDEYDFSILEKVSGLYSWKFEKEYQEKFKTYDSKYGYNTNDNYWKSLRREE